MQHWIWLILAVIFLIAEAATVTMVSLWFAAGCLAALVVALTGGSFGFQVFTALAVSAALLACLRPVIRKHFTPKLTKTNVDAVVGSRGYVLSDIDNISATGKVKARSAVIISSEYSIVPLNPFSRSSSLFGEREPSL
jgi:membrane protein implicated in regulation of membrane protease activity